MAGPEMYQAFTQKPDYGILERGYQQQAVAANQFHQEVQAEEKKHEDFLKEMREYSKAFENLDLLTPDIERLKEQEKIERKKLYDGFKEIKGDLVANKQVAIELQDRYVNALLKSEAHQKRESNAVRAKAWLSDMEAGKVPDRVTVRLPGMDPQMIDFYDGMKLFNDGIIDDFLYERSYKPVSLKETQKYFAETPHKDHPNGIAVGYEEATQAAILENPDAPMHAIQKALEPHIQAVEAYGPESEKVFLRYGRNAQHFAIQAAQANNATKPEQQDYKWSVAVGAGVYTFDQSSTYDKNPVIPLNTKSAIATKMKFQEGASIPVAGDVINETPNFGMIFYNGEWKPLSLNRTLTSLDIEGFTGDAAAKLVDEGNTFLKEIEAGRKDNVDFKLFTEKYQQGDNNRLNLRIDSETLKRQATTYMSTPTLNSDWDGQYAKSKFVAANNDFRENPGVVWVKTELTVVNRANVDEVTKKYKFLMPVSPNRFSAYQDKGSSTAKKVKTTSDE